MSSAVSTSILSAKTVIAEAADTITHTPVPLCGIDTTNIACRIMTYRDKKRKEKTKQKNDHPLKNKVFEKNFGKQYHSASK